MRIFINGKEALIDEPLTVAGLVDERGLDPSKVVVEHNLSVLPQNEWGRLALADGDKIEIIAFVGGG